MNDNPIDLDQWTPSGRATVDYAVELLTSIHLPEVIAAEAWLLDHPTQAEPALVAALDGPSSQPAAVLLGMLGGADVVAPLIEAHHRGGDGLRAAVERGLAAHDSDEARLALRAVLAERNPPIT